MSDDTDNEKVDLDARIKEAEVYYSMGLFQAAVDIYSQLLQDNSDLNPENREMITDKLNLVEFEIANEEQADAQSLSTKDITSFKETLSGPGHETATTVLDSASAFKDLGLFKEAVVEYEKLLGLDYPPEEAVAEIMDCLLNTMPPDKAADNLIAIVDKQDISKEKLATIKFNLGVEMEKREFKELALDLYTSAKNLNPDDSEINNRMGAMTASLSSSSKYEYLLNQNIVTIDQLQRASKLSKQKKKSVESILLENPDIRKEDLGKSLSLFYGCPFREYDQELPIPVELLTNLKKAFLLQEIWVPLSWGKEGVEILVDNPRDITKIDGIRALIKTQKISFSVGIKEDIEQFIAAFFAQKGGEEKAETSFDDFDLGPDVSFEEDEIAQDDEEYSEASGQVVRLVDRFLVEAYRASATDIHIEPSVVTKATGIRFRMDGVCQEYMQVPNSLARGLLSRIKIMAQLDIAERRLPQDGKIKFRRKGVPPFELRVATLPTAGGFEDAVLRLLAHAGAMPLDDMGLTDRNLTILKNIIAKPYGLILVVGPTGSGKTTTLHASLGYINKPGIKIWTAEDPVEITQGGLRQVEAKPKIGLDFARIMRAFLRADPDVIMIGEMRDNETAAIGIEASLTGHLVLSTLHTNSAPETITRLLDMGLNPLNFSDAFLGVLAQRLVRKLCKKCRKEFSPSKEEFDEIVEDYGREYFELTGITYSKDLKLYKPVGCGACSSTGYKGRMGVHELMEGTPAIKKMIKKQADTDELFRRSMKDGMTTLKQDGLLKVFQGLTDVSEVRRVCIA